MRHAHVQLFLSLIGLALIILGILVFWLPEVDQPTLTAPLVCLSTIFAIFWCVPLARSHIDGRIDWFHPAILFMLIYVVYFIFPGVWLWLYHNYHSIWVNIGNRPAFTVNSVFVLGVVSILFFGLGSQTKPIMSRKPIVDWSNQGYQIRWKEMRYLILVFLVIGGVFKYYHFTLFGSLTTDIFRYLSPSVRNSSGIYLSQFFIMLESMLDWAALLAVFYYIVRYKKTEKTNGWPLVFLIVVTVFLVDYVLSAKRSGVIPLILLPLIWYHYIIRRLSIGRAGVFFLAGIFLIAGLLMARIALPLLVQNLAPTEYIGKNASGILAFYVDSGELSTFDLIAASVVQRDELLKQIGGPIWGFLKYSFSTLIIFIPRAIWPDKPIYEDLSHVYYRFLIGSNPGIGFAPTLWGTSFLLFHLVGLVVGMYVLGWLFKSAYSIFQPQRSSPFDVFLYSIFYWMAFQFVRFGTTGFVIVMFVQSMFIGVLAVFLLYRKRRAVAIRFMQGNKANE